jgi:transcriptional regulator of met regulon
MDSVEVITQQRHVAQVRAVEHVANPAHERNRADGEIDTDIANHAQERPGRHAETSRLLDQVGRHAFRGQHPNAWDQVQQRVGAEAEIGSWHADRTVEKPRQCIKPRMCFVCTLRDVADGGNRRVRRHSRLPDAEQFQALLR